MYIICRNENIISTFFPKILNCSACQRLTIDLLIEGIQKLECSIWQRFINNFFTFVRGCGLLKKLDCSECPLITNIPLIDRWSDGLQELNCSNCPLLTNIPLIKRLQVLECYNCPLITNIPLIDGLKILYCWECIILKQVPLIGELQILDCSYCPLLRNIRQIYKMLI